MFPNRFPLNVSLAPIGHRSPRQRPGPLSLRWQAHYQILEQSGDSVSKEKGRGAGFGGDNQEGLPQTLCLPKSYLPLRFPPLQEGFLWLCRNFLLAAGWSIGHCVLETTVTVIWVVCYLMTPVSLARLHSPDSRLRMQALAHGTPETPFSSPPLPCSFELFLHQAPSAFVPAHSTFLFCSISDP